MRRSAFEDQNRRDKTAGTHVSGVHAPSTRPAPYVEESAPQQRLVGSIPIADLAADFQPIVSLDSGETRGYEVLPRCCREDLTELDALYARATFEKCVGELGRAIRTIAVRECAGSALFISVHPGELKDRFLVRLDDPICRHDAQVYLQLSQSSLSGLPTLVIDELGARSGVSLALDDFGAGPATLKQLVDLEPRVVKLDRELISGLDRSVRKQIVVRGVVKLCEQLGARVIAKGIDHDAELAMAIECGVAYGQGRVLGEPSSLPTISTWPDR
jgi:EAL domain-containing protein (putative c-di-GMP-specific phosphodiesterase class I)